MSLLNFNLVMMIHKMLVLLENYLDFLKDSIFECFFKEFHRLLFKKKKIFFSQHMIINCLSLEEENIIKDKINFYRMKKH